jgi:flavin-binding protein dodecin
MASNDNDNTNSVAKVMEISVRSTTSFDDAIQAGIARASKTLRGVTSAWVKEQRVEVEDGRIVGYQANLLITFTLEG